MTLKSPHSVPPYRIENMCKDVVLYFIQVRWGCPGGWPWRRVWGGGGCKDVFCTPSLLPPGSALPSSTPSSPPPAPALTLHPSRCLPLPLPPLRPPPLQLPLIFRTSDKDYVDSLAPGQVMPYAWDEIKLQNRIRVQVRRGGVGGVHSSLQGCRWVGWGGVGWGWGGTQHSSNTRQNGSHPYPIVPTHPHHLLTPHCYHIHCVTHPHPPLHCRPR